MRTSPMLPRRPMPRLPTRRCSIVRTITSAATTDVGVPPGPGAAGGCEHNPIPGCTAPCDPNGMCSAACLDNCQTNGALRKCGRNCVNGACMVDMNQCENFCTFNCTP